MQDNTDLISIIVPVYNRSFLVRSCINSILCQTYRNIELLLIDDGSTDDTLAVCVEYANKDNRVCVLHQKNGGPASARNAGLDGARGQYIMFVDSDDCIHPRCVEKMYDAMQEYGAGISICEYGEKNEENTHSSQINAILVNSETVLNNGLNDKENTLYCWAKLWFREAIKDIRFQNFSFCEDALFTSSVFLSYKNPIVYLKGTPLYYYLKKNDSITKNLSNINLADSLGVVEAILNQTTNSSDYIRKSAINYCVSTAFFAYLQAHNDGEGDFVRLKALRIIKEYRKNVFCNFSSSIKVKGACLVSYFSMNILKVLYKLAKIKQS